MPRVDDRAVNTVSFSSASRFKMLVMSTWVEKVGEGDGVGGRVGGGERGDDEGPSIHLIYLVD